MMTWQQGFETIAERDAYIFENELFTDCSFTVGYGEDIKTFKCHRSDLAKTSRVFEAMLYGELSVNRCFDIQVPDIQPAAFKLLLRYIYCGKVVFSDVDVACEVLYAAKKYLLPSGFVHQCRAFIWANMYPNNIWSVLKFAEQNDEQKLFGTARMLVQEDTSFLLTKEEFCSIPEKIWIHLLNQDVLHCSEVDLYRASVRWARHQVSLVSGENAPTVREVAEPLLSFIRFLSMTTGELSRCLIYNKILTSSECINIFMNISLPEEETTLPPGLSANREKRVVPKLDSFDVIACPPELVPLDDEPKNNTLSILCVADIHVACRLNCLGVVLSSQNKPENCESVEYDEDLTVILYDGRSQETYSQTRFTKRVGYDLFMHVPFKKSVLLNGSRANEILLKVKVMFHKSGTYENCQVLEEKDEITGNFGDHIGVNLWKNKYFRYIAWFASEYVNEQEDIDEEQEIGHEETENEEGDVDQEDVDHEVEDGFGFEEDEVDEDDII